MSQSGKKSEGKYPFAVIGRHLRRFILGRKVFEEANTESVLYFIKRQHKIKHITSFKTCNFGHYVNPCFEKFHTKL